MRIIRLGHTSLIHVHDRLLSGDYSRSEWFNIIHGWLLDSPNYTFFAAAIDGESFLAYVLATVDSPNLKFIFLHQAWVDPTAPAGVSDQLFSALCSWAKGNNMDSIRMETTRNPHAMLRKWNFQPVSCIMEHKISDTYKSFAESGVRVDLLGNVEVRHEKEQQQAEGVQPGDEGSEEGPDGLGEAVGGEGRDAGGSIADASGGRS